MSAAIVTLLYPAIAAFLIVTAVTGIGLQKAMQWCPALAMTGAAMQAGAGAASVAALGVPSRQWLVVVTGVAMTVLGLRNLRRVDQYARRRDGEPE